MSADKIFQIIIGIVALLIAFFILCPLLGVWAWIGQLIVVIIAIVWLLKVAGVIS